MSILYKMGEKVVVILTIYGAIYIFYYFVFAKTLDMSNEKWKSVKIDQLSPRKTSKDLRDHGIHPIKYGRKSLCQLLIFLEIELISTILDSPRHCI